MMQHQLSMAIPTTAVTSGIDLVAPSTSAPASTSILHHPHKAAFAIRSATLGPQSPALRPEDLHVKPWYAINESIAGSSSFFKEIPDCSGQYFDVDVSSTRALDASSSRTSSVESEHQVQRTAILPRKACMDLNEAVALLDEMFPNPEASPRTPRLPLTPNSRSKRARSKSSDNSSNYSNERLNEKENHKEKKRPFLKKIGLSLTEDRPFLAKLAPRILGKPYLEKIGPSRAVEKPFLEKIGSSRTLDKFTFDTPKNDKKKDLNANKTAIVEEEPEVKSAKDRRDEIRGFTTGERRKSGKNFLSKMYSFETEDLEDTSLERKASHRGPLRGASLDDVLDSGPSSMPRINELSVMTSHSDIETVPSTSVAELVKCRVTTSEEIISSGTSLNSPMEVVSWGNSPRRKGLPPSGVAKNGANLFKQNKSNESVPNSPTKRTHSVTPEKVTAVYKEISKKMTSRQASEDVLDKRKSRHDKFEPRGASSDNLTKERVVTPVFAEIGSTNINGKGSNTSVVSTSSSLKQFYEKYESQEVFTETYADFKRRTQGNFSSSNALKRLVAREKMSSPSFDQGFSSKDAALEKMKSEGSPKIRSKSVENDRQNNTTTNDKSDFQSRRSRNRSVLRKQQGIDHSNYPTELEDESSQRKKMIHEPSQETLDLLSELQKVKSLLKTPSIDKTYESDIAELKPFPRRILLTDQEFCLSIERENSIRRPSRKNSLEVKSQVSTVGCKSPEKVSQGLALFEKRCLSLDYVDDEKSAAKKTEEPRALSSSAARSPRSDSTVESSDMALLSCDSKSYSSDVFNSPTEEAPEESSSGISVEKEVRKIETEIQNLKQEKSDQPSKKSEFSKTEKSEMKKNGKKNERIKNLRLVEKKETKRSTEDIKSGQTSPKPNNSELEVAGNREVQQTSPKRKCHSDSTYEVTSSPKATPFRIKKGLGRVSVEETVKQESFTVDKIDCKDVAGVQKKAKCLPL